VEGDGIEVLTAKISGGAGAFKRRHPEKLRKSNSRIAMLAN